MLFSLVLVQDLYFYEKYVKFEKKYYSKNPFEFSVGRESNTVEVCVGVESLN